MNKFLLAGDKSMPELHLKQPGFIYSASGPIGNLKHLYRNELDKAFLLMTHHILIVKI